MHHDIELPGPAWYALSLAQPKTNVDRSLIHALDSFGIHCEHRASELFLALFRNIGACGPTTGKQTENYVELCHCLVRHACQAFETTKTMRNAPQHITLHFGRNILRNEMTSRKPIASPASSQTNILSFSKLTLVARTHTHPVRPFQTSEHILRMDRHLVKVFRIKQNYSH